MRQVYNNSLTHNYSKLELRESIPVQPTQQYSPDTAAYYSEYMCSNS